MRIYLILSLIISLFAVVFALVNNEPVTVNIGVTTFEGSLALILLATLLLGVIVGILASLPGRLRAKRKARSLEKQKSGRTRDRSDSSTRQTPE